MIWKNTEKIIAEIILKSGSRQQAAGYAAVRLGCFFFISYSEFCLAEGMKRLLNFQL